MKKILLTVFVVLSVSASGQKMSLNQCLEMASKNNMTLQTAQYGVEKSRIMERTAWDIDKTELSLSQDPTSGGSPDNALSLSQTIDFPTVYVARRHQLKAETRSSEAEAVVVDSRIRGEVAALYYQLVYQKEKLNILKSQDTILSRYEDIATKRYQAGEVRQLEPLNASRLRHENKLAIDVTEAEMRNTQSQMARLLGQDVKVEPSETALSPVAFTSGVGYNYSFTPAGQLSQSRLSVADEAVKVAKSGYAPSLSLGLRTQMVIKGWNPYHVDRSWNDGNFMGFEVGVGIPIFNGATRARVKAARKERQQMELQMKDEAMRSQSEYTVAVNRVEAAKRQMDYYSETGIGEADRAADISAKAYESGEIGYIEYVNAMTQGIETRLKYASVVNDYNQAVISLHTLLGAI